MGIEGPRDVGGDPPSEKASPVFQVQTITLDLYQPKFILAIEAQDEEDPSLQG